MENKEFTKFSEIEYVRPNFKEAKKKIQGYMKEMNQASNYKEYKEAYQKIESILLDVFSMTSISSIRNTINMNDEFYDKEEEYLNKASAVLALTMLKLQKMLLKTKFKKEIDSDFGPFLLKQLEYSKKVSSPKIILLSIQEGKLSKEYSKIAATAKTNFMGEDVNFYGLLKHLQALDREERKNAFLEYSKLYKSISDKLDDVYTKLIAIRCKEAKRLKFKSYTDYQYIVRGRYDYNKDDVAKFRESVRKYIVPLCEKLYEEQKKELGLEKLYFYDEDLTFKDGNAIPYGNKDELVEKAKEMYSSLSNETKEFFEFMTEHELFDLETKEGKHMGGYCTFIPSYKAPFIFSNFNGTSDDVDVLTHEAGHAFQGYLALRSINNMNQIASTSEINEIHSMTMEHFTYPYMDKFFKENKDKYLYHHLTNAIKTIPYLVCVDEFQHKIFENPKMTNEERRNVWKKIENTYMPWRDYDNDGFFSDGAYWMIKQHIFLYPFYYIDYALAEICALQLFLRGKEDFSLAWNDYLNLCKAGGTKGYFDLLKVANLDLPFDEKTIEAVASKVEVVINEFRANVK
ncbi:MAG: M3 family oligoendopeptidase [Acholeplasmatales bacterium]|nr:M3 family oligoendopeptidase [Acholeplasmatales bacterium]